MNMNTEHKCESTLSIEWFQLWKSNIRMFCVFMRKDQIEFLIKMKLDLKSDYTNDFTVTSTK